MIIGHGLVTIRMTLDRESRNLLSIKSKEKREGNQYFTPDPLSTKGASFSASGEKFFRESSKELEVKGPKRKFGDEKESNKQSFHIRAEEGLQVNHKAGPWHRWRSMLLRMDERGTITKIV